MIGEKLNVEIEITKITNYLIKKKAWDYNYLKYSEIRKTLIYITNIKKLYFIRKLFLIMVDRQIFIKKQNPGVRSYMYRFRNPYELHTKDKQITIIF
tara:strand:- start:4 stop:294 length:291 start_codon:yes stop_codon:yes gene_type:complete